ncbi:MAG: DUF5819 family protein [Cryomorphaceae bacterium]
MQNSSFRTLPSWLSWLLLAMFCAHFLAIFSHQFGKEVLPKQVVVLAERYASPWFYQNYEMFAPDPHTQINKFVYRIRVNGEWSAWKDPVYPHLQNLWYNRFGNGGDMVRILTGIADKLYEGRHFIGFMEDSTEEHWFKLPGFILAKRYIEQHESTPTSDTYDAYQVGVLTEVHRIDAEGNMRVMHLFQSYPEKTVAQ